MLAFVTAASSELGGKQESFEKNTASNIMAKIWYLHVHTVLLPTRAIGMNNSYVT
jgi:hypothetical protein